MDINKISPLFSSELATQTAKPSNGTDFSSILDNLINQAEETNAVSQEMTNALLSGEINDLHSVTIAAAKASASVELVIAVRNKVVEVYNEVMRMQV